MSEDTLFQLQTAIEGRLKEQIARHRRIDPMADTRKIIDLQMRQERERLDKFAQDYPELAQLARDLRDDWLPDLEQRWKGR